MRTRAAGVAGSLAATLAGVVVVSCGGGGAVSRSTTPDPGAGRPSVRAAPTTPAATPSSIRDLGSVTVIRRHGVRVLGSPQQAATLRQVATLAEAAIPRVTAVWGPAWARRATIVVPADRHDAALLTGVAHLGHFAAITTSELDAAAPRRPPHSNRVTINPSAWSRLRRVGREVVITHELTHVASSESTGRDTPKWLAEGLADYVGFLGRGLPPTAVARELARRIRTGNVPVRLPPNRAFRPASARLAVAYEQAWLACVAIADQFGQGRLVRFYRAVGRSRDRSDRQAVDHALHTVLGLDRDRFVARWRALMRAELAG